MLPTSSPDRIDIAFDDDRLVDHAGLLLPATLAGRLGLRALADAHLDLGDAPGRANVGDKLLTLVASALAGGDCIADAAAMRAGGAGRVLGCTVKAPSTLGTFLRSFRWGHVRQLDRLSRELLARAWAAGAGPGAAPFTIDLDTRDFVAALRGRGVTPHVARNDRRRRSAVDGRTTRHAGYAVSQRRRKRVEEVFGWLKTVGGGRKLRYVGQARNRSWMELAAAAYNLVRLAKLELAPA